jgi:hypothetical protein
MCSRGTTEFWGPKEPFFRVGGWKHTPATQKVRHARKTVKNFNFDTLFRPLLVRISSDFKQNDTSLSLKIIL